MIFTSIFNIKSYENEEKSHIISKQKTILLYFISMTCLIFIIPLGIIAYFQGNITLGLIDHLIAIIIILNLIYLKVTSNYQVSSLIGISSVIILYMYLFSSGGVNNTAHLWYFTFPLAACFLLGTKKGVLVSSLLLIYALFVILNPFEFDFWAPYSTDFAIRFIPSYIVVILFSFAFEYYREKAEQNIFSKNIELNEKIYDLKYTETKLLKSQCELEDRVNERTSELTKVNKSLKNEVLQKKIAEKERQRLEKQLALAEKMEALGTLAGGVAHDLNNILSSIVLYPDIILNKLPKESELRKPISKIQDSGLKASIIVSDLLTLARRGVDTKTVVNINQIVLDYLDSLEFKYLMDKNNNIKVRTDLDNNIPNIIGSSMHLDKTIMNIFINSLESIKQDGIVLFKSEIKQVKEKINQFNTIKQGEYVILTISDSGDGIEQGYLNKIFEPFFSTKKMGSSGSGLGMAIVWNTIKDHNAFIEIQTERGFGTSFSLYFPYTDKAITKKNNQIRTIMGRGESILIIDNNIEQNKLTKEALKTLGYLCYSSENVYDILKLIKEQQIELIILDVSTNEEKNLLNIYDQIIEINNNQKVIFVSNYSFEIINSRINIKNSNMFLRKPFTLEQISEVVNRTLYK